jgi:methylmalonyl-CoA epimerase
MKIICVDHIGIAVKNIDDSLELYKALKLKVSGIEEVSDQKVKIASIPVGETEIELLEPTGSDSTIAKYITKKGEGLHHIALRVENIDKALQELKGKNIKFIDEKPKQGAGGKKIIFARPGSAGGLLLELCQKEEI